MYLKLKIRLINLLYIFPKMTDFCEIFSQLIIYGI